MCSQNNAIPSLLCLLEQHCRRWVAASAAILVGAVAAVNLSAQTTELNTKLVTSPDHFFDVEDVKAGYVWADFETDENGDETVSDRGRDVQNDFQFKGLRFSCLEKNGTTGIYGYRFKRSQSRHFGIATQYPNPQKTGKTLLYSADMRVDFCLPNGEAATVSEFGLFLEITSKRHAILEAYNASGHRLAICEAATDKSAFLGVHSARPISFVVVRPNRYLQTRLGPDFNKDFAIDDVVFDKPVASLNQNLQSTSVGQLAGDRGAFLTEFDKQRFVRPANQGNSFNVMLKNGSVIHCLMEGGQLVLEDNAKIAIRNDQVIGVWGSNRNCLYPNASDFTANSKAVLVMPTFRVLCDSAKIDWQSETASLSLGGFAVRNQELDELSENLDGKAELLNELVLQGANEEGTISLAKLQSLWFDTPPLRSELGTILRTNDGQEFVLNEGSVFQLERATDDGVTIRCGDESMEFPIENVNALIR